MGINVSVEDMDGNEHPSWDRIRCSGDSDIPSVISEVGETIRYIDDYESFRRPVDVDAFYEKMIELHGDMNKERWQQLRAILKDEKWWLYYSY